MPTIQPIVWAVRANDIGRVRERLEQGLDPYEGDKGSAPPLILAAERGYLAIVRLLLEHGVDPNRGGSALSAAARTGRLDVIKYLLEKGQDPNAQYGGTSSALEIARLSRKGKAAALLEGLDPDDVEEDDDDDENSCVYPQSPAELGLSDDFLNGGGADLHWKPIGTRWCTGIDIAVEDEKLRKPVRDVVCFIVKNESDIHLTLLDWYRNRLPKEWDFGREDESSRVLPYRRISVTTIEQMVLVLGTRWTITASMAQDSPIPKIMVSLLCAIDGEHDVHLSLGKRVLVKRIWIE